MRRLRLTITQKLIIYLFLASILPLLITGAVAFRISSATLYDETTRTTTQLVSNQRDFLDLQLEQIESLLLNLSGVEEIRNVLENIDTIDDNFTKLTTQTQVGYILNGYSNLHDLISIDIFSTAGTHYHVGDTLNVETIRTDLRDRLFEEALTTDRLIYWAGIEDNVNVNSSNSKVITASKVLNQVNRDTLQEDPIALMLVNYSVDSLYQHFSSIDLGENAQLVVVDAKNRYVYHPNRDLLGETISPELEQIINMPEDVTNGALDGTEMTFSRTRSDVSDWSILGMIPVETFYAKSNSIGNTVIVVLIVSFLGVLLISWYYNREVVQPIKDITLQFKLMQQSDTDKENYYVPVKGNDEIAELSRWFNSTRILYRINRNMITHQKLTELFQNIVDDVVAALSANRVLLVTVDMEKREVLHSITAGSGAYHFEHPSYEELNDGITGWVLREQKAAYSSKNTVDERESDQVRQRRLATQTGDVLVVPLYGREGIIGTVTATNSVHGRSFTQQDIDLMIAIVNQTRIAIENVQLVQSLRTSEEKFVKAFKASPEPMTIISLNSNRYLEVNTSFLSSTGYVRNEVVNHTEGELNIWYEPEQREKLESIVKDKGFVRNFEAKIQTKTGQIRTWLMSADIIELDGEMCQIAVAKDISERIEAERQRIELALERERIDLMAEFMTKASHEFKTPLSIINTSTYLMSKTKNPSENVERISLIASQVDAIEMLVDSLLFMTKLNAKDVDLTMEKLDLNVILRAIDYKYQSEADKKGIIREMNLSDYPLALHGNVSYLQRALTAFYDNAIKYNTRGGKLTVNSYHKGDSHIIDFIDTGIGISEQDQERIFERFFQVDKASTQRGFGLGLPIARTIIELHGGRIDVESRVGEGSSFRVVIPASAPQEIRSSVDLQDA